MSDDLAGDDDDDEVFGDFEDLVTGEKFEGRDSKKASSDSSDNEGEGSDDEGDDSEEEDSDDEEAANQDIDEKLRKLNAQKKANARNNAGDDKGDSGGKGKGGEDGGNIEGEEFDETEYVNEQRRIASEKKSRYRDEFGDEGLQVMSWREIHYSSLVALSDVLSIFLYV
jgi:hypothetical protein